LLKCEHRLQTALVKTQQCWEL